MLFCSWAKASMSAEVWRSISVSEFIAVPIVAEVRLKRRPPFLYSAHNRLSISGSESIYLNTSVTMFTLQQLPTAAVGAERILFESLMCSLSFFWTCFLPRHCFKSRLLIALESADSVANLSKKVCLTQKYTHACGLIDEITHSKRNDLEKRTLVDLS